MLTIFLEEITSHNKETLNVMETKEDDEKSSKKQDVLLIKYKKDGDEFQIYIQFDKTETLVKLNKKLAKNIKKVK